MTSVHFILPIPLRKITLSNVGGRDGRFEIFCPPLSSGASFGVSPAAGTLAAGEEIAVKFEILTNEQGTVRDTVKIRVVELKVRKRPDDEYLAGLLPATYGSLISRDVQIQY